MGNSNQCKIEHKISNDYESTQAGALCRELGLEEAKAHVAFRGQGPHPADMWDEFQKPVLKRNVCHWARKEGVAGSFKYTVVYSQNC